MTRGYAEIFERIQEEIPVEELTREKVAKFVNASKKYPERMKLVEEFIIATSFTLGERFAKERKITLDAKTSAKTEKWKKKGDFIVIRKKGRFVTWKKLK